MALPSYPWRFAHLAALWGYGVSQPVFSMLLGEPRVPRHQRGRRAPRRSRSPSCSRSCRRSRRRHRGGARRAFPRGLRASPISSASAAVRLHGAPPGARAVRSVTPALRSSSRPSARMSAAWPTCAGAAPDVSLDLARCSRSSGSSCSWRPHRWRLRTPRARTSRSASDDAGRAHRVRRAPRELADARGRVESTGCDTPASGGSRARALGTRTRRRSHEFTTHAVPAILTGASRESGDAADARGPSRQPVHAARRVVRLPRREPVTRLCPVTYCPEHGRGRRWPSRVAGTSATTSGSTTSTARCRRELPREHGGSAKARAGAARVSGVDREHRTRARDEFDRDRSADEPALARCTSCTRCSRMHRGSRCRPGTGTAATSSSPGYRRLGARRLRAVARRRAAARRAGPPASPPARSSYTRSASSVELLERLDETGLYDRALVIVDRRPRHQLPAGGWKRHATTRTSPISPRVPLFVKYPGQRRGRVGSTAGEDDRHPPDDRGRIGVGLPWPVDGRRSGRGRSSERQVGTRGGRDVDRGGAGDAVAAEVLGIAAATRRCSVGVGLAVPSGTPAASCSGVAWRDLSRSGRGGR